MNHDRPSTFRSVAASGFVSPVPALDRAERVHEQMNALSVISTVASLLGPGLSERDRDAGDRHGRVGVDLRVADDVEHT